MAPSQSVKYRGKRKHFVSRGSWSLKCPKNDQFYGKMPKNFLVLRRKACRAIIRKWYVNIEVVQKTSQSEALLVQNKSKQNEFCLTFCFQVTFMYTFWLLPRGPAKPGRAACFHHAIDGQMFVCLFVCISAQMKIKGFLYYFVQKFCRFRESNPYL